MSDAEDKTSSLSSSEESDSLHFNPVRPEWLHPYLADNSFRVQGITSLETRTRGLCRSAELELYWAVCDNNVSLAEKLLAESHSPNAIFRWRVEFAEETREYSQFPLHRAVQSGNPELVGLLLQYGSDPNSKDCAGRTPLEVFFLRGDLTKMVDFNNYHAAMNIVIAEMLLKRATEIDEVMWYTLFNLANETVMARWSFMELLLLDKRRSYPILAEYCNIDYELNILYNIVSECGEVDDNSRYGYGVLEHCLKAGVDPRILQRCLGVAIKHHPTLLIAMILLIKAGVNVNCKLEDSKGKTVTPLRFVLEKITESVDRYLEKCFADETQSGDLDSEFSALWLLIKAGSGFPADIHGQLVHVEVSIKLLYDKARLYSETNNWSCRRRSAVLSHLQRCLDIIQEIQPPYSLMELSRIVVRKALGPWSEDRVEQLKLPLRIKECITYHDCQTIVDGVGKYDWTWHDVEKGRVSPLSFHSDSEDEWDEH